MIRPAFPPLALLRGSARSFAFDHLGDVYPDFKPCSTK
jgi:hypothetical protein